MAESSNKEDIELLKQRAETSHKRFVANIENITGMRFGDMEAIRTTFGEGMKNGSVKFVPGDGKDGVFGHLWHPGYGEDTEPREHLITNPDEAAFLQGLQLEANEEKAPR